MIKAILVIVRNKNKTPKSYGNEVGLSKRKGKRAQAPGTDYAFLLNQKIKKSSPRKDNVVTNQNTVTCTGQLTTGYS